MPELRRRPFPTAGARHLLLVALGTLAGCSVFTPSEEPPPVPAEPPPPQYAEPLATHTFPYDPKTTGVVGTLQATIAREEDTLSDIARRFNLGYDEVVNANPGVDPWLPGAGRRIVLPTQFVLPDAPHDGIVVNLAALRLYYFPKAAKKTSRVRSSPTRSASAWSAGRRRPARRKSSPNARIRSGRRPRRCARSTPPKATSCRARVPPGPDNPLGAFAMNLGWPSYLMHGTNKPAGVGMRASHGCIRLYPEDIATLFQDDPDRHEGHRREPAAGLPCAGRCTLRAVLSAARGTPGGETGGGRAAFQRETAGQDVAAREAGSA